MKSIIIPTKLTQNKELIALSKIELLNSVFKAYSDLETMLTYSIYKAFKNNPYPNTTKNQKQIQIDIIQIIHQQADNQEIKLKEPSLSAINNGIWKLIKAGVLIEVDGLYILHSVFNDVDLVDQIVFRYAKIE